MSDNVFSYEFYQWTLVWFRDRGRGQEAADKIPAEQHEDLDWPIAVLRCKDRDHANECWENLRLTYGINAMTYSPIIRARRSDIPMEIVPNCD